MTSLIPHSSGFLLLCCYFSFFFFFFWSSRKAGSTFSFCKREQKPVLSARTAVSILCRSPLKLLQVSAQLHSFPGISSALGSPPQTPREEETGNKGSTERSRLGFCFFRGGGEGEGLRRSPPPPHNTHRHTHPHTHTPEARAWRGRAPSDLARRSRLHWRSRCRGHPPSLGRGGGCSVKKTPVPADCFLQAWEWYLLHAAIFKYFSETNLNPHELPTPEKKISPSNAQLAQRSEPRAEPETP